MDGDSFDDAEVQQARTLKRLKVVSDPQRGLNEKDWKPIEVDAVKFTKYYEMFKILRNAF